MVLEIKLKNFYSIKDEVILDLRAGNLRSKRSKDLAENVFTWEKSTILKTVAIYGANASGKSNIIKAIRFCCSMVFNSHTHNEDVTFNFKPFAFNKTPEPSEFSIKFVSNNIEYDYSYTLTPTEILTESLYHYPNGRKAKIFVRNERVNGKKSDKYSFGNVIKRPLDVAVNTSKKTLYISRASQMDREIGKIIYNYFNHQFILGYHNATNNLSVDFLFNKNKGFLLKALQIADSDIVNITMEKEKVMSKSLGVTFDTEGKETIDIRDKEIEQIRFKTYHRANPNIAFDFDTQESDGTKKLFYILLNIIDIIKNNKILLIDEIEDSLHTKIVEFIVDLFHKSKASQLIFSTHNTNLIDLERMRKDQIYFVNKNEEASSELYSLYDYKDFRENMDAEKGYLQGRFDAIPFIDYTNNLINSIVNE